MADDALTSLTFASLPRASTLVEVEKLRQAQVSGDGLGLLRQAEKMCRLFPKDTVGFKAKGLALMSLNRSEEAVAALMEAAHIDCGSAEIFGNLGCALIQAERLPEALRALSRALELEPISAAWHHNYALAALRLQRLDEAFAHTRQAILLDSSYTPAQQALDLMMPVVEERQQVRAQIEALRQNSEVMGPIHGQRGAAHAKAMRYIDACHEYEQAARCQPNEVDTLWALANSLSNVGEAEQAVPWADRAMALAPERLAVQSLRLNLDYYRAGIGIADVRANALHYANCVARQITPMFDHSKLRSRPTRRLKIGLVSGDLQIHPVCFFLHGLLHALREQAAACDFYAYPTTDYVDEASLVLRQYCRRWTAIDGMDDEQAARTIAADGIHILFDLSGFTRHHRLLMFARKPAPVQVTWIGWFGTTAIHGMDYIMADGVTVPDRAAEAQFLESVWRLPQQLFFSPPTNAPAVSPAPWVHHGFVTFGCFHNPNKVSPDTLDLWARVLTAVPAARLRWVRQQLVDLSLCEKFMTALARRGIARERLSFVASHDYAEYLANYAQVDFVLDTVPVSGGTTTCEALWQGVPTLTLAGEKMCERLSATSLSAVGLHDWIVGNADDYVRRALSLTAPDALSSLSVLRGELRLRMQQSLLCNPARSAPLFSQAVWGMWQRFQDKPSP